MLQWMAPKLSAHEKHIDSRGYFFFLRYEVKRGCGEQGSWSGREYAQTARLSGTGIYEHSRDQSKEVPEKAQATHLTGQSTFSIQTN